jgi:two-component system, cell cycle sensor histidine kinase and response regulator CckA
MNRVRYFHEDTSLTAQTKYNPDHLSVNINNSEELIVIERDLAVSLSAVQDLQTGLQLCFRAAIAASGMDCGGIYLVDSIDGTLNLVYHQGLSQNFVNSVSSYKSDSINNRVVMQGNPLYQKHENLGVPLGQTDVNEGLLAAAIVPIKHNNKVIGCLNLASHRLQQVPSFSRTVLETIAALIGGALARLKAEAALKTSEEIIKSVFNSSPDAITLIGLDGLMIDCNPEALKLFGYAPDANIKGLSIFNYVIASEHKKAIDNIKEVAEKGVLKNIEFTLIKLDGSEFSAELSASAVYNADNKPSALMVITKDISERRKADEALRQSEERFRTIFEKSGDAIFMADARGNFLEINDYSCEDLGYSREELLKMNMAQVIHPEDLQFKPLRTAEMNNGDTYFSDRRLIRKDGSIIQGEFTARMLPNGTMIGIGRNVTKQRQVEKELAMQAKMLDAVQQSIIAIDKDGKIAYWNEFSEQLLGLTKNEVLGKPAIEMVKAEKAERLWYEIGTNLAQGNSWTGEVILKAKSGNLIPVLATSSPILEGDKLVGSINVVFDITEHKRAEKELRLSEERFEKAFRASPNGISITRLSDGRVIDINESFLKITGYTREEVFGRTTAELQIFAHPDDRELLVSELLKHGRLSNIESQFRRKSGEIGDLLFSAELIELSGEKAMLTLMYDITERKRAEKVLQESEELYRTTFECTGTASVLINPDTIITMANMEFEKLTEFSKAEIEGKMSWTTFVVPEDLEFMLAIHQRRRKDRTSAPKQYEFRLKTKSGQIRNILLTIDIIPGNLNSIASLFDITVQKQAEEALRLSEDKFAKAFKANPAALAITRLSDGKIVECNNTIKSIFGYEIEEILGHTTSELDIWADKSDRLRMVNSLIKGEPVRDWEVRFKAKDGSIIISQYSAEILQLNNDPYILAAFIDITKMKKAEEELINSKLRYQELFESLLEGVALLDKNGYILFCNPAFLNIHEAGSMDMLIGKNISDFVTNMNSDTVHNTRYLWEKGFNSQTEIEIKTIKGNKISILASGTPRMDDKSNLIGVIVAVIDITEFKRLQEFASHAQRLEAAGRIAGQVAHDFNNLLAPMVAYPDLIKTAIPDDAFVLSMVNDIEIAAKAMADINQQLLTLSRRGHYNLEIINLNDIINLAINQVGYDFDRIEIDTKLEKDLLNIKGGHAQILRIISNLISNALDAMHDRGRLMIKSENYYLDKRSGINGMIPKGEYCKVSVSDTGCGIAEETLPKIFDAFFTTKVADKKRGSGLGLSVVHAVMEDHHGYIDLESKVGKGTTFYLYFPLTRETVGAAEANELKGGSESILIIDDDSMQRNVNSNLLKRLGYQVEAAESGEDAIRLLAKKTFDLLIIDMIMPGGMDGTETYRKSIGINHSQKALIISGFAETEQVKDAMQLGAGGFLRKPLSMTALATAIRKELDRVPRKHSLSPLR